MHDAAVTHLNGNRGAAPLDTALRGCFSSWPRSVNMQHFRWFPPWSRYPVDKRCEQPPQCCGLSIRRLRSPGLLCSLGHLVIGGSSVPGGGTFVLADAILTPTLEPSLLSSQVQTRPGTSPCRRSKR